jgi:hypothetical protein
MPTDPTEHHHLDLSLGGNSGLLLLVVNGVQGFPEHPQAMVKSLVAATHAVRSHHTERNENLLAVHRVDEAAPHIPERRHRIRRGAGGLESADDPYNVVGLNIALRGLIDIRDPLVHATEQA